MPRHDLDPLALVGGVVFGGIAMVALLEQGTGLAARWVVPVLLILAGMTGLLATRPRNGSDASPIGGPGMGSPDDGDG